MTDGEAAELSTQIFLLKEDLKDQHDMIETHILNLEAICSGIESGIRVGHEVSKEKAINDLGLQLVYMQLDAKQLVRDVRKEAKRFGIDTTAVEKELNRQWAIEAKLEKEARQKRKAVVK